MNFIETRGNDGRHPLQVSFSAAILAPMSSFGGLYVPEALPQLGDDFLRKHLDSDYKTLARDLLALFEIDIDADVIDKALALYDLFDDPDNPAPVVRVREVLSGCWLTSVRGREVRGAELFSRRSCRQ